MGEFRTMVQKIYINIYITIYIYAGELTCGLTCEFSCKMIVDLHIEVILDLHSKIIVDSHCEIIMDSHCEIMVDTHYEIIVNMHCILIVNSIPFPPPIPFPYTPCFSHISHTFLLMVVRLPGNPLSFGEDLGLVLGRCGHTSSFRLSLENSSRSMSGSESGFGWVVFLEQLTTRCHI